MGQHRDQQGLDIIESLVDLGQRLGYEVVKEWPIPGSGPDPGGRPQQIDVCWITEGHSGCPMFVFEVESRCSTAAVNNAHKLFSKPTATVQKPLFFFHIFLSGDPKSTLLADLERHWGSFNYKVFAPSATFADDLVVSILEQHRRISSVAFVDDVIEFAAQDSILSCDPRLIAERIYRLDIEHPETARLASYADLCLANAGLIHVFEDELVRSWHDFPDVSLVDYPSYIGANWQVPVHIAWLIGATGDKDHWLGKLRWWQQEAAMMPMITRPHGRNRSYDWFVCCGSPAVWALCAALAGDHLETRQSILLWMNDVLCGLSTKSGFRPFHAAWTALVAAGSAGSEDLLDVAMDVWQHRDAGASEDMLAPPAWLPLVEGSEFPDDPEWPSGRISGMLDSGILRSILQNEGKSSPDPRLVALEFLLIEPLPAAAGAKLACCLASLAT